MITIYKKLVCVLGICFLSATSHADIITFDFTGRLIVADGGGNIIVNNGSTYTPIAASLTYNTETGFGGSGLSITMNGADFLGTPPTFHDITMTRIGSSNLIDGEVLVDWSGTPNMPLHIEWDATGLFNAIDYGLQAGDVLSGSGLYRAGELLTNISSATPYSSILEDNYYSLYYGTPNPDPQGSAPLAATSGSLGLTSGPFAGIRGYFDIGSGNSMYVTSVSSVPVPAAVWLFGSGLLGLVGVAKRKACA